MLPPSESLIFGRPLRDHQKKALDRFAFEKEMALFWEMGTGKTMSAIAWLRAKYNAAACVTSTMIISPVATLYNWEEEFKLAAPEKVSAEILVPYMRTKRTKYTMKERAELITKSGKKIVILNPDALDDAVIVKAFKAFNPSNVVIDEAHRFKAHNSKRLKKLLTITDYAENRAILTGTPILNSYLDLWAPFRILDKGATLTANYTGFRETYFIDKNAGFKGKRHYFPLWQPKPAIDAALTAKIAAKSSRITKEECLDLPDLEFQKVVIDLSPEQRRAYDTMEAELISQVREGICSATNAVSKVTRLLQIASGHLPVETDEMQKEVVHFKDNPRLSVLNDLLEELTPHHKVIVWATFAESYPKIREILNALNCNHAELVGGTTNRQEEIEKFRDNATCRVMLSNPQAGGVGVGMQAASYSIYHSRKHSLGDRLQSLSRNHRGGSEIHPKITAIDLVARETIDEAVLDCLIKKEDFSDSILDRLQKIS